MNGIYKWQRKNVINTWDGDVEEDRVKAGAIKSGLSDLRRRSTAVNASEAMGSGPGALYTWINTRASP